MSTTYQTRTADVVTMHDIETPEGFLAWLIAAAVLHFPTGATVHADYDTDDGEDVVLTINGRAYRASPADSNDMYFWSDDATECLLVISPELGSTNDGHAGVKGFLRVIDGRIA